MLAPSRFPMRHTLGYTLSTLPGQRECQCEVDGINVRLQQTGVMFAVKGASPVVVVRVSANLRVEAEDAQLIPGLMLLIAVTLVPVLAPTLAHVSPVLRSWTQFVRCIRVWNIIGRSRTWHCTDLRQHRDRGEFSSTPR